MNQPFGLARNHFGRPVPSPRAVFDSSQVLEVVRLGLRETFLGLKLTASSANTLTEEVIGNLKRPGDLAATEQQLRCLTASFSATNHLREALDQRALLAVDQIRPYLSGATLLDIGCGDGMIASHLAGPGRKTHLVDVVRNLDARVTLPFSLIPDHGLVALPPGAETALLLTVLHHATHPSELIASVAASGAQRVVVIESVLDAPEGATPIAELVQMLNPSDRMLFCVFGDWFFNRVLTDNAYVPYNFGYKQEWIDAFGRLGYRLGQSMHLGIDQNLVPEIHELMVFDR